MSRQVQITFDAHDPRALSTFWRDVLGYVHPGPPGVYVPEGADPLDAWDEFLAKIGVPEEARNSRSAIEDPELEHLGLTNLRGPWGFWRGNPFAEASRREQTTLRREQRVWRMRYVRSDMAPRAGS